MCSSAIENNTAIDVFCQNRVALNYIVYNLTVAQTMQWKYLPLYMYMYRWGHGFPADTRL